MRTSEPLNGEKLFLNTEEAAQKLGITRRTLDKWRYQGGGPKYIKVGNKLIGYREIDLIEYININIVEPCS